MRTARASCSSMTMYCPLRRRKLAQESVGEPVYFETMLSREDRIRWNRMTAKERTEQEKTGDFSMKQSEAFTLSGYLDNRMDGFPDIRQTWHGAEGSLYFLISEKGFANIPTEKKTLYMELTADPGKDPAVNAAVQRIISEENQERSRMTETSFEEEGNGEAGIFCISKSDLMSAASSYIRGRPDDPGKHQRRASAGRFYQLFQYHGDRLPGQETGTGYHGKHRHDAETEKETDRG